MATKQTKTPDSTLIDTLKALEFAAGIEDLSERGQDYLTRMLYGAIPQASDWRLNWLRQQIDTLTEEIKDSVDPMLTDGTLTTPVTGTPEIAEIKLERRLDYLEDLETQAAACEAVLKIGQAAHKAVLGEAWKRPTKAGTAKPKPLAERLKRFVK